MHQIPFDTSMVLGGFTRLFAGWGGIADRGQIKMLHCTLTFTDDTFAVARVRTIIKNPFAGHGGSEEELLVEEHENARETPAPGHGVRRDEEEDLTINPGCLLQHPKCPRPDA